MYFQITEWHKKNKNDWVATDPKTYELIDRDDDLMELAKRINEKGLDVVYGKNWFSPHHYAKENRKRRNAI